MRAKLQNTFEDRDWSAGGKWPVSGFGSTLENTERLRAALPDLFRRYKIKTFVDAPCGDWFWMQHVDLDRVQYIGADISSQIIEANKTNHSGPNRTFLHLDITSDPLPDGDLLMCRDCLFHLKTWLRWEFFRNFAKSNNKYLLTTVVQTPQNRNLRNNGKFAAFNPMNEPYNFPKPKEIIPETADHLDIEEMTKENTEYRHRASFLWSRKQIADSVAAHDAANAK
ncbi:class I SAM-dependent methyltransferase [uncultured Roseovarius sp.]|uniref:class I SAM-dependent methyltransferase n=1 Tax=Roseovarius sp. TaxID=1486281 RepID=UPI0025E7F59E|nr:class I SAM-dependent methyltransferase [uncultured Roseovarius sp.]